VLWPGIWPTRHGTLLKSYYSWDVQAEHYRKQVSERRLTMSLFLMTEKMPVKNHIIFYGRVPKIINPNN
jgi:hypothetical protein